MHFSILEGAHTHRAVLDEGIICSAVSVSSTHPAWSIENVAPFRRETGVLRTAAGRGRYCSGEGLVGQ